ncbi:ABC transporter permease [Salinispira pacifica]|uniref:ABC transporter protein n=1 Tax=Salinispira pacifica TaxID=1307761 RepID=V5WE47_9SPIO|nr:ABC transporter permease [Salinispira pacifica]AHC14068.1 ABC transporter protein [Salinispira pacifica]
MSAVTTLLAQDGKLIWRNGHAAVVAGIALLMIALVIFLPEEFSTGPGEYLYDAIPGSPLREALVEMGADLSGLPESQQELDELLEENPNAIGITVHGTIEQPEVNITQPREIPRQSINLLQATIDTALRTLQGADLEPVPVRRLRPRAEIIPVNLAGLPVFLALEVGILGFLLVAVFVFQEKQEGTIRAYRITPAGLWPYLISKAAVFLLLSLSYGIVVVAAGMGLGVNWPAVIALIAWASLFMTVFGLGFAAWFDNLSSWFFPGLAVLILNMLPFFSYIYPVFTPLWVSYIPSYGLLFALREALFPTGNPQLITRTLLTGLAWLGAATVFAAFSVRARLLQGD